MADIVVRRAARLIVLDPADRVLLFEEHDPRRPDAPTWWITPGGGLDSGENHVQAARRELFEETGLDLPLAGPVHEHAFTMSYRGQSTRQVEQFFVSRTVSDELDFGAWTDFEQAVLRSAKWWSLDELSGTEATVYPPGLAELVRRVVADTLAP